MTRPSRAAWLAVAVALGLAAFAVAALAQQEPRKTPSARKPGTPSTPAPTAPSTPAPSPQGKATTAPEFTRPPAEIAQAARSLEELGAYSRAVDRLRQLRAVVPPDADLELQLALDEARAGMLDSAWTRLHSPLLEEAIDDSMPVRRRTDYPWERDRLWTNEQFDGWNWYIARARAEVGAQLGRWREALAAARLGVAARVLAGREWLILAVCAGRAGDPGLAAAAAAQAAYLDRSLPEAQYLHGLYEWKAGRRASAQASFRTASMLDSMYREPALALMRSRLPMAAPDTLPIRLLTGVREIGLLTSPARPKLEEFVQMEVPAELVQMVNPNVPDSLRGTFPPGKMALSLLIDESGRIVLHELPWYEPHRFPAPMVSSLTAGLREWRFQPPRRNGGPHKGWVVIQLDFGS